jgi:hypothetical protein
VQAFHDFLRDAFGGGEPPWDRGLGTGPWLTLTFTLFGIAAGFLNLFRDVGLIGRGRQ